MDIKTFFFEQPAKMTEVQAQAMRDIVTFITHELKKISDTKFSERIKITLPIHQLFGIYVTCRIIMYNHNNDGATYLDIESDRFYDDVDDNPSSYTLFYERIDGKNLIEKINKIIEILQNLKLDAYSGKFAIMNDEYNMHQKFNIAWEQLLNSHSHIATISAECCVCLTRTRTKTACKHSICIECAEKIVKDDNGDHDCIPCPLCREDITYGFGTK